MDKRLTVEDIKKKKGREKFVLLTAADFPFAAALDRSGAEIILIGDSLANVVLGLESTRDVGMGEMVYHAKAVARAVKHALLVADMPYEAYQEDIRVCVKNAERFIKEAGCDAVKIEWFVRAPEVIAMILGAGIPVMGHIGLTPQTASELGGFKVQGKEAGPAKNLIAQAKELEGLGCFSILMECVPDKVAALITKAVQVPTIGIGAGPFCDGQALVTHDMLGLFDRYTPKFVKKYAALTDEIIRAAREFKKEVSEGFFPDRAHSFGISDEELRKIEGK